MSTLNEIALEIALLPWPKATAINEKLLQSTNEWRDVNQPLIKRCLRHVLKECGREPYLVMANFWCNKRRASAFVRKALLEHCQSLAAIGAPVSIAEFRTTARQWLVDARRSAERVDDEFGQRFKAAMRESRHILDDISEKHRACESLSSDDMGIIIR